jgi:hypothetical protein
MLIELEMNDVLEEGGSVYITIGGKCVQYYNCMRDE